MLLTNFVEHIIMYMNRRLMRMWQQFFFLNQAKQTKANKRPTHIILLGICLSLFYVKIMSAVGVNMTMQETCHSSQRSPVEWKLDPASFLGRYAVYCCFSVTLIMWPINHFCQNECAVEKFYFHELCLCHRVHENESHPFPVRLACIGHQFHTYV